MIRQFFALARPHQWYKNLLVFLALFFSGNLLNGELLAISTYAFAVLVLVSSANYALNDIFDCKKDRISSEKKNRPVASGKIRVWQAYVFAFSLLFLSIFFSLLVNIYFFYCVASLFLLSLFYTLLLKKIFLADVIAISSNFVLRAAAGAFAISVFVSPWLVSGIFIFAFFLVLGKRQGERALLGRNAGRHRHVLKYYTSEFTKPVLLLFPIFLIAAFAVFSALEHPSLIWSLPLFAFLMIRYAQLSANPRIASAPEKAFSDRMFLAVSIIFIILSALLLYLK